MVNPCKNCGKDHFKYVEGYKGYCVPCARKMQKNPLLFEMNRIAKEESRSSKR